MELCISSVLKVCCCFDIKQESENIFQQCGTLEEAQQSPIETQPLLRDFQQRNYQPYSASTLGGLTSNQGTKTKNKRKKKKCDNNKCDRICQKEVGVGKQKTEEERILDAIVEEVGENMIDLHNDGYHHISRAEAKERSRWYSERLQNVSPSLIKQPSFSNYQLFPIEEDCKNGFILNKSPSISSEEKELMKWAFEEISEAVQCIQVRKQNDFVVPLPFSKVSNPETTLGRRPDTW